MKTIGIIITKAKLSKMNMLGLGKNDNKKLMKKKNITALEELIKDAKDLGVKLVACEMTMDLMDIPKGEFISEVSEVGGVGTYLDAASKSYINLFI